MTIDIRKCENGWQITQRYLNSNEVKVWVFKNLPEMAEWIVENAAMLQ